MSEQDNKGQDPNAAPGGDQQPTIEELKAQLDALKTEADEAKADAAKLRSIKKDLEKQRDELKKSKKGDDDSNEDYKKLWQEAQDKLTKGQERAKSSDINAAVAAQLAKVKIVPEYQEAAVKLLDKGLIEWDEENGVDSQSVVAAIQKLKSSYNWMFEKKVAGADPKPAADGASNNDKTMKRAEFDKLDATARYEVIKKDYRIVD